MRVPKGSDSLDERQQQHRATAVAVLTLCAIPVALVLGLASCAAIALKSLDDFDFDLANVGHDHRLAAIPIDPKSCPALAPVRADAVELTRIWNQGLGNAMPPDEFRAAIDPRLLHFEMVLVGARSHVPAPVAKKFDVVVWEVESGRADLGRTEVASNLFSQPMMSGLRALADASDLVGTACGEELYTGPAF